jgi:hypothetical protein
MTVAHLAGGSIVHRLTHLPHWMDGAIVFVIMSGLVLGMVQRRVTERSGRPAYNKLVRRAFFLYCLQLAIMALAIAARTVTGRPNFAPTPSEHDGWVGLAFYAVTMQLPAPNLTILSMYVILLLAAVPIVWLCASGRWWVAAGAAGAVWFVGTLAPTLVVMPHIQEVGVARFNWATWLMPFAIGLIVGWFWNQANLAMVLRKPAVIVGSSMLYMAIFLGAQIFGRMEVGGGAGAGVDAAFQKWDLSLPTIVYGLAAVTASYGLLCLITGWPILRSLKTWLALIGSYSLDCFVILCLGVVLFPVFIEYAKSSSAGVAVALTCVVIQTIWSWLRRRKRIPFTKGATGQPVMVGRADIVGR